MTDHPEPVQKWLDLHSDGILQNRIYYDMPEDIYRAVKRTCQSDLKIAMSGSWRDYWWQVVMGNRPKQTFGQRLGSAVHNLFLEPHVLEGYKLYKGGKGPTTKDFQKFIDENPGKVVLHPDDLNVFELCKTVMLEGAYVDFREHSIPVNQLFKNGKYEVSFFWGDPETGVLMKGRVDDIDFEEEYILDLKTTARYKASTSGFKSMCREWYYQVQDAVYTDAIQQCIGYGWEDPFYFLTIELKAPVNYGLHRLHPEERDLARDYYRTYLKELVKCRESGYWPSYRTTEPVTLFYGNYT